LLKKFLEPLNFDSAGKADPFITVECLTGHADGPDHCGHPKHITSHFPQQQIVTAIPTHRSSSYRDVDSNSPAPSHVDEPETTAVLMPDICRVCRSAGDSALYYPCLCTGSIKYVHQDCLLEWLKYSKKEVCELCSHKYSFQPIYRPDMPTTLPFTEIVRGPLCFRFESPLLCSYT
uniref:RING-type E3 ubiquitin transferase n=1 Tax=Toxocara canis TaxID=6265 RepID=A0A183U375_TOXCA